MTNRSIAKLESAPLERPSGRSARVGEAVTKATLELLSEEGYSEITLEKVAERASVNRATLYRRWHSKPRLVASAMLAFMHKNAPSPDTGSVREDLLKLMLALNDFIVTPLSISFFQVMGVEARKDPDVAEAVSEFWENRFKFTRELIDRGVKRGELKPVPDNDVLIEQIFGPFYLRVLRKGSALSKAEATEQIDRILGNYFVE